MIRRLHVRGWRAFEDLSLELDDGLTFVVAENGVGKTSLVQAAAWGLFGALSGVDAKAARRIGSSSTVVDLDLELPDGRLLNIMRQVEAKSAPVHASIGDAEIDDGEVAQVIAETFGASREFLSKTTILPSDTVVDQDAGSFELRTHLCRVFGVDHLEVAAARLTELHRDAEATAKKQRQEIRRATTDLVTLRAELEDADEVLAQAEAARDESRAELLAAETRLREAKHADGVRLRIASAQAALEQLIEAMRGVFGEDQVDDIHDPTSLATMLESAEAEATELLDQHRRALATVEGRLEAIRAAAAELDAAEAECPVCRRSLDPDDVSHAHRAHERDITALVLRGSELRAAIDAASLHATRVRELSQRAARLPTIEAAPAVGDAEIIAAEVERVRERAESVIDHAAEARSRRTSLQTQIADEEQAALDSEAAQFAHRHEAVTNIASEVMRSTASAILAERIDPLATELAHRWKRVFGERGALQLRPDGSLVLKRGIHEIPFSQFSSGEKVVALLAVRVLILGASTRASFLWLDEPLEHLDPKNRRVTASLMGAAGKHVRQILVTTYEAALARHLASAGSASIRYVRSAG